MTLCVCSLPRGCSRSCRARGNWVDGKRKGGSLPCLPTPSLQSRTALTPLPVHTNTSHPCCPPPTHTHTHAHTHSHFLSLCCVYVGACAVCEGPVGGVAGSKPAWPTGRGLDHCTVCIGCSSDLATLSLHGRHPSLVRKPSCDMLCADPAPLSAPCRPSLHKKWTYLVSRCVRWWCELAGLAPHHQCFQDMCSD